MKIPLFHSCVFIAFVFFTLKSHGQTRVPKESFPPQQHDDVVYPTIKGNTEKFIQTFEDWMKHNLVDRRKTNGHDQPLLQIPVIFHIIHFGEDADLGFNISEKRIKDQLSILNRDFRRENSDANNVRADFLPVVGQSLNIEFVLANFDPFGLPISEPGIHRVREQHQQWNHGEGNEVTNLSVMRHKYGWPKEDYLNIFVCNFLDLGIPQGIGSFPHPFFSGVGGITADSYSEYFDGVVIHPNLFGSNYDINLDEIEPNPYPDLDPDHNKGRVLVHEVGHWLGLHHVYWGFSCSGYGDYCQDTPYQDTFSEIDCRTQQDYNSCDDPKDDMYENYMNRSLCKVTFTNDQVDRMLTVLTTDPLRKRQTMSNKGAVVSQLDIYAGIRLTEKEVCVGELVQFFDNSFVGQWANEITSYTWTFYVNDDPMYLSNNENPSFVFPIAGTCKVKLKIDNGLMSDEAEREFKIRGKRDELPQHFDFDTSLQGWYSTESPYLIKNTTDASFAGSGCAVLDPLKHPDEVMHPEFLRSPLLDLTNVTEDNLTMRFHYAHSGFQYVMPDLATYFMRIAVSYSLDCGDSFINLWVTEGEESATSNALEEPWIPAEDEWSTVEIDLSALIGLDNVLLQFEFSSERSPGNVYIDELDIFSSLMEEGEGGIAERQVYPNPVESQGKIKIEKEKQGTHFSIFDLNGNKVYEGTIHNESQSEFDLPTLDKGLYILRIYSTDKVRTRKFFVNQ